MFTLIGLSFEISNHFISNLNSFLFHCLGQRLTKWYKYSFAGSGGTTFAVEYVVSMSLSVFPNIVIYVFGKTFRLLMFTITVEMIINFLRSSLGN